MRRDRKKPLTEKDLQELDKFAIYLRQKAQAEQAGVDEREASRIIHAVVYEET